jgi:gliding motility-associated-like protein
MEFCPEHSGEILELNKICLRNLLNHLNLHEFISQFPINFPILSIPMNRFKKHLMLLGLSFLTLLSLPNFATNTITTRPNNMVDSVRLSATRTTTTIPGNVNIDVKIAGFLNINEFVFTIQWDATKLQLLGVNNNLIPEFTTANIDLSNSASGKIRVSWSGTPLTLVDNAQIFTLRFLAQVPSATPIPINFVNDSAPFNTIFINSAAQPVPWTSSYGQVRIVNCTNITPSLRCSTATLLCEKDLPVCGRLPNINTQDNPGNTISCGNIQNNVWLAFIAGTDSLKLKIKATNCTGNVTGLTGSNGIQASVLETNDCSAYRRVACLSNIGRDGEDILVIPESGSLIVGKQYYIMIDGFSGDVCDFQIDLIAGSISSSSMAAPSISGTSTACANQSNIAFSIPAQTGAQGYIWKIAGNNATILSGNSTPSVNVNWGTVADSVCVRVIGRCDTTQWSCKAVSIGTRSVRDLTVEKCATATYRFNNQNLTAAGPYSATFMSASGCDSVVNLLLVNYPTATRTIDSTVCIGSSVRIGIHNYSVAGTYKDTLIGASFRGCDSIVTLNLIVVQSAVSLVKNGDLSCTMQSVNLTANYNKEPFNANATFEWTNSSGTVVSTLSTATVTQGGIYTFKLTLSLNGISCSQTRTITVTRTGAVPAKPDLTGALVGCIGTMELYRINNPIGGLTYNWTVNGGVFTGGGSSQISVDWNANATSALVCVNAENACGKGDSICKNVALAKIPAPLSMTGDSTVCPNSTAVYFVPATGNVTGYQWVVTNGTIVNGQGTPFLTVAWGTNPTGRVCLTPSNRCGTGLDVCKQIQIKNAPPDSVPIVGNIAVCNFDTTVFTSSASVSQFDWTVPTGATILRGQGTNTVLVAWGTALGNVTVGLNLTNSCGLQRRVTLNVNIKNAALATPVIAGAATVCPMSRSDYSIPLDASVTSYKWTLPSGATVVGSSMNNVVTVDWGSSVGGDVCIEILNSCNVKKSTCFTVEVKATLDSLPLTGPTIGCKDSTVCFEVQNDVNASGYVWVLPTGSTILSGLNTYKICVKLGSSSGFVRVLPLGGCADGLPSRRFITVKTPPSAPASIVGTTTLCEGTTAIFGIGTLSDATSYQWQMPNGARVIGDSTGSQVTVSLGTSRGGQICARGINSCGGGFWACTTLNVVNKPVVFAGNDTVVCGNRFLLRGLTSSTVQTWSVVDKPTGAITTFTNPINVQTDVTVSKSGIYVFKFESSNAIGCAHADSIVVEFKGLPTLTLASEDCNIEATQYTVRLNIVGNGTAFTMMGSVPGILSAGGSIFTSNPITNGTAYNFMVKDNFGCVSNEVRGLKNCPCYTNAGTLRADSLIVCYGTTGRVTPLNDARLDGNDTYEYILHDGTADVRGTILKRNRTGIFDATTLQFNRVYYISYAVGDSLTVGIGSVDLTKPCASTSRGIPIIFKTRLIAGLTGDTTICRLDKAVLHFNINRRGGYNLTLRDENNAPRVFVNFPSGQSINVTPSVSTTYKLLEVKDEDGCLAELTDSARINHKTLPVSNAGIDRSVCVTGTTLDAAENLQYRGNWTSLTPGVRILTPADPKSGVQNLQNGRNILVWAVSDTGCPNYTVRDTMNIFLPLLPRANTLSLVTSVGGTVSGSVNENAPTGTYTVTRLTNPAAGYFDLFSNGSFVYHADTSFTGIVKFKFVVCSDICTRFCDTGEVRILIKPRPLDTLKTELFIPNAITPNGDGKNDVLKIDGIEQFPNNELVIFNRWGDVLYKAKPYQNDWQGVNQSGGELPEGTYYYVLKLNVNDGKILRGNMTILR